MAQVGVPVSSWPVRLITEVDAADEAAKTLIAGLTTDQLNWEPEPGVWSIGKCLDHLCKTNEVYLAAISSSLSDKRTAPVQEITPGWFGRWFLSNYVEPSPRTKRVRAPAKVVPSERVELSVLVRFLSSNREFRETVIRAQNYDVNRIRFRNPFVPLIRFTVGTGLEIVSQHEFRHLSQAERVKRLSNFPGPK